MDTPEPKKPEVNLFVLLIILIVTAVSQVWQAVTWPIRWIRRQF